MADNFLQLPTNIQRSILSGAETRLNTRAIILEKDIWLCWILQELFMLPINMAFKGGTSLSKAYNLIKRFSEDVDITIDYRFLIPSIDLNQSISKTALKKLTEQLKIAIKELVENIIFPHFKKHLKKEFPRRKFKFELSDDGEQLRIYYPTLFEERSENYLQSYILIEFGGRNSTQPNEVKQINTILAQAVPELELPSAQVKVLSPLRTFWEKATLIHVECHRNRLSSSPERLSRHWYDLALLAQNSIGQQALTDRILLEDVIQHKMAFFNASYAHYDKCLNGKFQLIPQAESLERLIEDYNNMLDSGMFAEEPLTFSKIIATLKELEALINTQSKLKNSS